MKIEETKNMKIQDAKSFKLFPFFFREAKGKKFEQQAFLIIKGINISSLQ